MTNFVVLYLVMVLNDWCFEEVGQEDGQEGFDVDMSELLVGILI